MKMNIIFTVLDTNFKISASVLVLYWAWADVSTRLVAGSLIQGQVAVVANIIAVLTVLYTVWSKS